MPDLDAQVKEPQADFQSIVDRADWVGACVAVQPGRVCEFGLGRSGTDRYAINRVWAYDGFSPVKLVCPGIDGDDPAGWADVKFEPVYSELLTLTQRAGTLLQELCQAGRYKLTFPFHPNAIRIDDPMQLWLTFLIQSLETMGLCRAVEPGGAYAACSQIRQGETTLAWIDQYAGVCLAGLAALKAALRAQIEPSATPSNAVSDAIDDSNETGQRTSVVHAEAIGRPDERARQGNSAMSSDDSSDSAPKTLDFSNLPWGSLREESRRFLYAWDDLQRATPTSLGQMQVNMFLALLCLARPCRDLGILNIRTRNNQPGTRITGQPYFALQLALDLGDAVGALHAKQRLRPYENPEDPVVTDDLESKAHEAATKLGIKLYSPPVGRGFTFDSDSFPFDAESIEAVRKAAERLPTSPLVDETADLKTINGTNAGSFAEAKTSNKKKRKKPGPKKARHDLAEDAKICKQWDHGFAKKNFRAYEECDKTFGYDPGTTQAAVARHSGRERRVN